MGHGVIIATPVHKDVLSPVVAVVVRLQRSPVMHTRHCIAASRAARISVKEASYTLMRSLPRALFGSSIDAIAVRTVDRVPCEPR